MNRGQSTWKWLLFFGLIIALVYATIIITPPYLNNACLKKKMENNMREFYNLGEEEMILAVMSLAKQTCKLPHLKYEYFYFDGEVMEDSVFRCKYYVTIRLPGNHYHRLKMEPEVKMKIRGPKF